MSRVQSIFKSMSWLFASNIVGFICGFIWTILIARYLQVSEYGILGFATSLSGILAFTTDWGITTYIVRHVSTDHSVTGRYLNNSIPLKTIFSAATFIITLICLLAMGADEVTVSVTVIVTLYIIGLGITKPLTKTCINLPICFSNTLCIFLLEKCVIYFLQIWDYFIIILRKY